MKDYYDILGVDPDATLDQIRTAYRQRIKHYHPDRWQNDPEMQRKGEERTRELNEAYRVLRDPDSRWQYDMTRRARARRQQASTSSGWSRSASPPPPPSGSDWSRRSSSSTSPPPSTRQRRQATPPRRATYNPEARFAIIVQTLVIAACLISFTSSMCNLTENRYNQPIYPTFDSFELETTIATMFPDDKFLILTALPIYATIGSPLATGTSPPSTATASPTPTAPPSPAPLTLEGPAIAYGGVSFTLDPALGSEVFVDPDADSLAEIRFSFATEGLCRDVGCVTVYSVERYRVETFWGGDILDELQAAIETQALDTFPTVGAAILLRAQTEHVRFEDGAGMRAIVMRGQDGFFANNEAVVYDFHGLTDDGRYYVVATFPIDAPILLSTYDPEENTNEGALPLPELPEGGDELIAVMREYNEEAERQLDLLDGASFTPSLQLLDALVTSLQVGALSEQ